MEESDKKSDEIKERTESKCKSFSIDSLLSNDGSKSNLFNKKDDNITCLQFCGGYNNCDNVQNFENDRLFGKNDHFYGKNIAVGDSNSSDEMQQLNDNEFSKEQHEDVSTSEEMCSRSFNEGNY